MISSQSTNMTNIASPTTATTPLNVDINGVSANILSDIGMASLIGAFTLPVAGAVVGVVSPMVLGLETALGSTGAGLAFLYPQAFQSTASYAKSLPTWLVAAIVVGGAGAIIAGTYFGHKYYKYKKREAS